MPGAAARWPRERKGASAGPRSRPSAGAAAARGARRASAESRAKLTRKQNAGNAEGVRTRAKRRACERRSVDLVDGSRRGGQRRRCRAAVERQRHRKLHTKWIRFAGSGLLDAAHGPRRRRGRRLRGGRGRRRGALRSTSGARRGRRSRAARHRLACRRRRARLHRSGGAERRSGVVRRGMRHPRGVAGRRRPRRLGGRHGRERKCNRPRRLWSPLPTPGCFANLA